MRTGASGQARLDELAKALSSRLSLGDAEITKLIVTVRFAGDEKHDSASEAEHLAALGKLSALVRK